MCRVVRSAVCVALSRAALASGFRAGLQLRPFDSSSCRGDGVCGSVTLVGDVSDEDPPWAPDDCFINGEGTSAERGLACLVSLSKSLSKTELCLPSRQFNPASRGESLHRRDTRASPLKPAWRLPSLANPLDRAVAFGPCGTPSDLVDGRGELYERCGRRTRHPSAVALPDGERARVDFVRSRGRRARATAALVGVATR